MIPYGKLPLGQPKKENKSHETQAHAHNKKQPKIVLKLPKDDQKSV